MNIRKENNPLEDPSMINSTIETISQKISRELDEQILKVLSDHLKRPATIEDAKDCQKLVHVDWGANQFILAYKGKSLAKIHLTFPPHGLEGWEKLFKVSVNLEIQTL